MDSKGQEVLNVVYHCGYCIGGFLGARRLVRSGFLKLSERASESVRERIQPEHAPVECNQHFRKWDGCFDFKRSPSIHTNDWQRGGVLSDYRF